MTDTGQVSEGTLKADVIKVAIIEDRREIREGLALLINGTAGYRCTGSFRSMEEALDKIGYELPKVALVDIGLPGMSGIEGIRLLKERYPSLLLLMLTVYDDDERIAAIGTLVDGSPPTHSGSDVVTTADEARRMVDKLNSALNSRVDPQNRKILHENPGS